MSPQKVIISEQLDKTLEEAISECEHDITFVLADETTWPMRLPPSVVSLWLRALIALRVPSRLLSKPQMHIKTSLR